jgi:hypothetical protein
MIHQPSMPGYMATLLVRSRTMPDVVGGGMARRAHCHLTDLSDAIDLLSARELPARHRARTVSATPWSATMYRHREETHDAF